MSLGQAAEEWAGSVGATVTGTTYRFHMALSNIDQRAPDGLRGPTEIGVALKRLTLTPSG